MNPKLYRDYCSELSILCDYAVKKYSELIKTPLNDDILKDLKKIKNTFEEFLNDKKSIYFLGHSSSGKSTFLNHIFGKIIIPQSTKIETRVITRVYNSEDKIIKIFFKNDVDKLSINIDLKNRIVDRIKASNNELILNITKEDDLVFYTNLVKSNNKSDSTDDPNDFIKEVNIYYPFHSFSNFIFYDTPGIDSVKDDTDTNVVEYMFSVFSSYIFFLFDASEPSQTKLKIQINNYKDRLTKIESDRLIFVGTHLDVLEQEYRKSSSAKSVALSVEEYIVDLKKFIAELNISYLDVVLLSLSSKKSDSNSDRELKLKRLVKLGDLEHKINMHSYVLKKYYYDLIIKEPHLFIEKYIIGSFIDKLTENKKLISKIDNKISNHNINYAKRSKEIKDTAKKDYFVDYLSKLKSLITKLQKEEKRFFNDNIDKIEKHINSFRIKIIESIDDDKGGQNMEYSKVKNKIKSSIGNIPPIDLSKNKRKFYHFDKSRKTPFEKGLDSEVFEKFMSPFRITREECTKIIETHYDSILKKAQSEYDSIKLEEEIALRACKSENEKIVKIINEIEKRKLNSVNLLSNINTKYDKYVKETPDNVFNKFLKYYRLIKLNN